MNSPQLCLELHSLYSLFTTPHFHLNQVANFSNPLYSRQKIPDSISQGKQRSQWVGCLFPYASPPQKYSCFVLTLLFFSNENIGEVALFLFKATFPLPPK